MQQPEVVAQRQLLCGRMTYLGWSSALLVGEIDARPLIERLFGDLDGVLVGQAYNLDSYTFGAEIGSAVKFAAKTKWAINADGSFGGVNVLACLDDALMRLNGRLVQMTISGSYLDVRADPSEEVFGLHYTHHNSCAVPAGAEKSVCRVGQGAECCAFLTMGGDGFACGKFDAPMARYLLGRVAEQSITARRIGNCALLGRQPEAQL